MTVFTFSLPTRQEPRPPKFCRTAAPLACLALLAGGCGRSPERVPLHPVAGIVTVKGAPADGAKVILFPVDESMNAAGMPIPTGVAGPDGRFKLTSYEPDDGAPAGEYRVGVIWNEIVTPSDDPAQVVTRDRLKGRYADPKTSGLKATVEAGATELPPLSLQ
jgi:hypothetical protein